MDLDDDQVWEPGVETGWSLKSQHSDTVLINKFDT